MWLSFLKHKVGPGGSRLQSGPWPVWGVADNPDPLPPHTQLPLSLYKKVLVIMHESILPHLAQPSLMIDFLTRAYDIGERGAQRGCDGPTRRGGCWGSLSSLVRRRGAGGPVGSWLQEPGVWPPAFLDSPCGWGCSWAAAPWLCVCLQGAPSASSP